MVKRCTYCGLHRLRTDMYGLDWGNPTPALVCADIEACWHRIRIRARHTSPSRAYVYKTDVFSFEGWALWRTGPGA